MAVDLKITAAQLKKAREAGQIGTLRNCIRMALIISTQYHEVQKVKRKAPFGDVEQPVTYVDLDQLEKDLDAMGLSLG